VAAVALGAIVLALGAGGALSSTKTTTLTLWDTGYTTSGLGDLIWVRTVAKRFERAHPGVKIDIVQKGGPSFIPGLRTAILSHSTPDMVVLWSGYQTLLFSPNLVDLNRYIGASTLKNLTGIEWFAKDGDPAKAVYTVPGVIEFYIMYY